MDPDTIRWLGSREAREDFRNLLDAAMLGEHIGVERSGKRVGVLVPYEAYLKVFGPGHMVYRDGRPQDGLCHCAATRAHEVGEEVTAQE